MEGDHLMVPSHAGSGIGRPVAAERGGAQRCAVAKQFCLTVISSGVVDGHHIVACALCGLNAIEGEQASHAQIAHLLAARGIGEAVFGSNGGTR